MKTALVLCCLLAAAAAAPQGFKRRPQFRPFQQQSSATGQAQSFVNSGSSGGPFGNTQISSSGSQAGGTASGSNASSQNSASTSSFSAQTPLGSVSSSQTSANSQQETRPCSGFFCRGGK